MRGKDELDEYFPLLSPLLTLSLLPIIGVSNVLESRDVRPFGDLLCRDAVDEILDALDLDL